MGTQVQWRGGTTEEHKNFTGASREVTVDTEKKTAVIHNGITAGGFPLAREDLLNVSQDTLLNKFNDLFQNTCPTGICFDWMGKNPPDGFLILQGQTIGANGSGANLEGSQYEILFSFLWENVEDTFCPVSSGRSSISNDDWQASKTLQIPDARRKVFIGADNQITNRKLGKTGGEESHQLTVEEMPAHSHILDTNGMTGGAIGVSQGGLHAGSGKFSSGTTTTGGNQPHNNMPPYLVANKIIKI